MLRSKYMLVLMLLASSFFMSCQKKSVNLILLNIKCEQTDIRKTQNLPDGVFSPDNPNFDFNDLDTWTGNMAQYVQITYENRVSFWVHNRGLAIASYPEVDLYYTLGNNNKEHTKTMRMRAIGPNERVQMSVTFDTSKPISSYKGQVFWLE